jgi:DNA-binding NarL/FixJ family response regulator
MISIIICDDQDIVREGLQTILSTEHSFRITATASDGDELISILRSMERDLPDIILLDLKMPVKNGIQATREIKKYWPGIKILVLTTYAEDAIRGTVAGNTFVDPSVAGKLLPLIQEQKSHAGPYRGELSIREQEILLCIAKGLSNGEIGEKLFLSAGTVRNYTSTIFSKLGVADRTEAAIAGLREGIFSLHDI